MLPKKLSLAKCGITLLLFSATPPVKAQAPPSEKVKVIEGKARADTVYKVGPTVSSPRAIYDPNPEYSEEARRAHRQGTCELRLVVGSDGNPRDIKVVRALGLGLDENATKAIHTWRFEPARRDGIPIATEVSIEVTFSLDDDTKSRQYLADLKAMALPHPPVSKKVGPCGSADLSHQRHPDGRRFTIAGLDVEGAQQLADSDKEQIIASLRQDTYAGTVDEVTSEVLDRLRAEWQNRGYF